LLRTAGVGLGIGVGIGIGIVLTLTLSGLLPLPLPLSLCGRQVYEELSPAVCGVLQGQYVCVMAYGQTGAGKTVTLPHNPNPNPIPNPSAIPNPRPKTGAGKTFTMQGGGEAQPGVVRLAAEEIFREAHLLQVRDRATGRATGRGVRVEGYG